MAQDNASKTDIILSKLGKLNIIALETHSLRESVEKINPTVEKPQHDFSRVERDLKKVIADTDKLQESEISLNKDVEEGKTNLERVRANSELGSSAPSRRAKWPHHDGGESFEETRGRQRTGRMAACCAGYQPAFPDLLSDCCCSLHIWHLSAGS